MEESEKKTSSLDARKEAAKLFNGTWDLVDVGDGRSPEQTADMITKAHASRYLWSLVGTPENVFTGDWQISHVYALSGMGAPALVFAESCLKSTLEHDGTDFLKAFAYEGVARAYSVLGDFTKAKENVEEGIKYAEKVPKKDDKGYVTGELNNIKLS